MRMSSINDIDGKVLRNGSQLVLRAAGENYLKAFADLISKLTREEGERGILLSTMWSANALSRRISLTKLPKGSLNVIDTVSLSLGSNPAVGHDFIFLSTPAPLESILVEIERLIWNRGNEINFLVLDSLTFLRRYYTEGQLNEFFHYLLNRMLEQEVTVIVFDQELESQSGTSKMISSVMDRTILLDGGEEQ